MKTLFLAIFDPRLLKVKSVFDCRLLGVIGESFQDNAWIQESGADVLWKVNLPRSWTRHTPTPNFEIELFVILLVTFWRCFLACMCNHSSYMLASIWDFGTYLALIGTNCKASNKHPCWHILWGYRSKFGVESSSNAILCICKQLRLRWVWLAWTFVACLCDE